MTSTPDLYFSVDVEADGPIPGPFSMLSFGLVVAGRFDGHKFESRLDRPDTFYRELKPISRSFVPEALKVSGLDRDRLEREGADPHDAMMAARQWVLDHGQDGRPVLTGFPLMFDWLFIYWYFERFAEGGSPFDHSAGLDMKTMYQQRAGVTTSEAGLRDLPNALLPSEPHTHNALEDALRQAEIFVRLFARNARD
jgi:DNA polymerase III epsilon subunit-like protein